MTLRIERSTRQRFTLFTLSGRIPHEIRDKVFEPFVTAGKENGLGLGLAFSRQAVLDHGGDMWIEPAAGARFVIRFPLNGGEGF